MEAKITLEDSKEDLQKLNNFAEAIMQEASRDFEIDAEFLPPHVKNEAQENFEKRVKKLVKETGFAEEQIEQELLKQVQERPFKIDYIEEVEGPFYRTEQVSEQVVVYINKAHRFYSDVFEGPATNAYTKNALALLLFAMAHTELRVNEDRRKWYRSERSAWSQKLETTLELLSQQFSKSVDDQMIIEEINAADVETKENDV